MNTLEAEYSFLAPTWKLPTVATTSLYPRTYGSSYLTNQSDPDLDWILWKNTLHNSRYIPSMATPRNYSVSTNHTRLPPPSISSQQQNYQFPESRSIPYPPSNNFYRNNTHPHANHQNESYPNDQFNQDVTIRPLPSTQKRRVQIIDHNRSSNGHANQHNPPSKTKPTEENWFGYQGNHFNIHEYLYGLSAPDPGSYVDAFKQHQRRLQDEKAHRKFVLSEYKTFAQNGGFGPTFGNADHRTYTEKINTEKRRKFYSKGVRENNQTKIEEQKRTQNNSKPTTARTTASVPKHQRAREYADKIEKPIHLKPMVRLRDPTSGNVIIRNAFQQQQRQRLVT